MRKPKRPNQVGGVSASRSLSAKKDAGIGSAPSKHGTRFSGSGGGGRAGSGNGDGASPNYDHIYRDLMLRVFFERGHNQAPPTSEKYSTYQKNDDGSYDAKFDSAYQKKLAEARWKLPAGSKPLRVDTAKDGSDIILHTGTHYLKSDGNSGGDGLEHVIRKHIPEFQRESRYGQSFTPTEIISDVLRCIKSTEPFRIKRNDTNIANQLFFDFESQILNAKIKFKVVLDNSGRVKTFMPIGRKRAL